MMNRKPVIVAPVSSGYCVYAITNLINRKRYIGLSSDPKTRWTDHKWSHKNRPNNLYKAMRKYGVHNFTFDILFDAMNREEAIETEKSTITLFGTLRNGYNETLGGKGVNGLRKSEESKRKVSETLKSIGVGLWNIGRKATPEQKAARSRARMGFRHSEATRLKMSQSAKLVSHGGHPHTEESKRKIGDANRGLKQSPEAIAKRVASFKARRNKQL